LPVDSITGAVADLADTLAETVGKVGNAVGDHVPDSVPTVVHDAVSEGVARGHRLLDRIPVDRIPGVSRPSPSQKGQVVVIGSTLALLGVVVVLWRRRRRTARTSAGDARWTTDSVRAVA
jgi:hypothetical protein